MAHAAVTPETRAIVRTGVGDIGAVVVGRGPDILLIHGFSDNAFTWLPVQRVLAPLARTHAIDLPGHGQSYIPRDAITIGDMADAAIAYLHAAGIEHCVVAGNSLGGGVTLGVLAKTPTRARAGLLLGSVGAPGPTAPGLRLLRFGWVANLVARVGTRPTLRRAIMRDAFRAGFVPTEEMVDQYWKGWQVPGRTRYISALVRTLNFGEPFPWLPGIRQRVHVMQGTEDRLVSVATARRIAGALPNAQLTVLSGIGHEPQHEATDTVTAALLELIQG